MAQEVWNEGWDADSDGALTLDEFQAGFTARVNLMDWDADADGALTAEEFSQGLAARMNFTAFDSDGDGMLSREELGGWFYGRYDRDTSEALEATELAGIERDFGTQGLWEPGAVTGAEILDSKGTAGESADIVPPARRWT